MAHMANNAQQGATAESSSQKINQAETVNHCPRCPFNGKFKTIHAQSATCLTECYKKLEEGVDYQSIDDLWPMIMANRDGMKEDEGTRYDMLSTILVGDDNNEQDRDLAREMMKALHQGLTKYESVRFTKEMAEYAVRVKVEADEARAAALAQGQAGSSGGSTVQDGGDAVVGGNEVVVGGSDAMQGGGTGVESGDGVHGGGSGVDDGDAVQGGDTGVEGGNAVQGGDDQTAGEAVASGMTQLTLSESTGTTAVQTAPKVISPHLKASQTTISPPAASGPSGQVGMPSAQSSLSTPTAARSSVLSPFAASFQPSASAAANVTAAQQPSTGTAGAGRGLTQVPPAPSNPTVHDLITSARQNTDKGKAKAYSRAIAKGLVGDSAPEGEISRTMNNLGLRTGFASENHRAWIETNHLTIAYPEMIHVYNVEMIREFDTNHQPRKVKKQADKLLVLEAILRDQQFAIMQARRASWVSDGDLVWSTAPLFDFNDASTGGTAQNIVYENEMGNNLQVELVTVLPDRTLDLKKDVGELFFDTTSPSYDDSTPGILTRGLNAFLTSFVRRGAPATSTTIGANKSFRNARGGPLDDQNATDDRKRRLQTVRAMSGFFLSFRPGIQSMFININVATSPFFENLTVHDLMSRFMLPERQHGHERRFDEVRNILKGVKVQITYTTNGGAQTFPTSESRMRFIEGTFKRVRDRELLRSPPRINANDTLVQFYAHDGQYTNYPQFPAPPFQLQGNEYAINVGKDPVTYPGQQEYYPASALRVVEWQPFRGRLTPLQTAEMIRYALLNPDRHKARLVGNDPNPALHHFGFAGAAAATNQAGLNALNIRPGNQFLQIPGRFLAAPGLVYSSTGQAKVAELACWDITNAHFIQPATIHELPLLNLSRAHLTNQHVNHIKQALSRHRLLANPTVAPQTRGNLMAMPQRYNDAPIYEATIQGLMANIPNPNGLNDPVLVVLAGKDQNMYSVIKRAADMRLGIKTVCVAWPTLNRKDRHQNLDGQTASNIALKYNLRAGGINHTLTNADLKRCLNDSSSVCDTIIIGADVTHPTKSAHEHTPSIASVVGSTDTAFQHYPGSMRLQHSKREDIAELWDMVKERLLDWHSKHGRFPSKMLFYRDGVSESQYDILRRRELPQLQIAINEAYKLVSANHNVPAHRMSPGVAPSVANKISRTPEHDQKQHEQTWAEEVEADPRNIPLDVTFVVVGKRHNTRFYATTNEQKTRATGGKRNDNVRPGLAVDQVITHPFNMDFYLQSHQAIQGMGRAAHYYILRNNMGLTIDELQSITHALCYAYAKATRGVSYYAPAYYADRLCDRGRAYLRHWLNNKTLWRAPRGKRNNETVQQYRDFVAREISQDVNYWMFNRNVHPQKYGAPRKNPWHPNLDDTMFYL